MRGRPEGVTRAGLRPWVVGLVAGLGGGLFSLGGGTLTIPLMLRWLHLDAHAARGTALAAAVPTSLAGAWLYARAGQVEWPVVLAVALPALLLTPLVGYWTERWPGARLRRAFGGVVLVGALALVLRDHALPTPELAGGERWAYLVFVGVVEGLVAGSVGVSGGPVLAPLLVLGLGLPQQTAQGCSLAARVPAVLAGLMENWRCGHVRLPLLPGLVGGGLVGVWLGSHLALALPEARLRWLFAGVLFFLGWRFLRGR